MVICLERDADLHMAKLMPLPLTVSCSSKIQIGLTCLASAHPGSPGQRAIKRVCVCVCVCVFLNEDVTFSFLAIIILVKKNQTAFHISEAYNYSNLLRACLNQCTYYIFMYLQCYKYYKY